MAIDHHLVHQRCNIHRVQAVYKQPREAGLFSPVWKSPDILAQAHSRRPEKGWPEGPFLHQMFFPVLSSVAGTLIQDRNPYSEINETFEDNGVQTLLELGRFLSSKRTKNIGMKKGLIIMAGLFVALASCKSEEKPVETTETPEEICYYSYDNAASTFEWTAYKTSSKLPVKGSFNEIIVNGGDAADDEKAVIESLSFSMKTATVETNDEARNKKIADSFFGVMEATGEITGKVKSLGDDGKATIEVKMNNVSIDVVGDYTLEEGKFDFNATIDVAEWNAMAAVEALSKVCEAKHTGDDGVLKTWSEVALSFSTQLSSDCE